jgi:hypothetical protein
VYPWKPVAKERQTTITAGFLHSDGVLLCADTQQETGEFKTHGGKLRRFDCAGGTVAFAFAGNSHFATSAIEECERSLEGAKPTKVLAIVKRVLDGEYKRVVLSHPEQAFNANIHYSLLFAVRPVGAPVQLYATYQTTFHRVTWCECMGFGGPFAEHLVRTSFSRGLPERRVLHLAANMLATVKDHVPSCGGESEFLSIRNGLPDRTTGAFRHRTNRWRAMRPWST